MADESTGIEVPEGYDDGVDIGEGESGTKNVVITLDGSETTIQDVQKIRTHVENSKNATTDWVPKDTVSLGVKHITEDGTYHPINDGYYGYSKIVVEGIGTTEMGTLIEKTVTKNGTYNISDESGDPYGYSVFTVNVDTSDDSGGGDGGSTPTTGKDEDGNDAVAETDDDGNVNITILPTDIKVIIPPSKLEYNRYETIDYSGISVYAYVAKMPHSIGTITTPIEEGSANPRVVIGGETITANIGDMVLYAPDRTGQNDVQLVWDGSKWVKSSNYSAEKTLWKSDDYPTGKIPFEELIFPIKRAYEPENITKYKKSNETGYSFPVFTSGSFSIEPSTPPFTWVPYALVSVSTTGSACVLQDGSLNLLIVTGSAESTATVSLDLTIYRNDIPTYVEQYTKRVEFNVMDFVINRSSDVYSQIKNLFDYLQGSGMDSTIYNYTETRAGNTVYIIRISHPAFGPYGYQTGTSPYIYNRVDNETCFVAIFGDDDIFISGQMTLPVQWKRPGDEKILETTFTAWMKDTGSDPNAPGPAPTPEPS